MLIRILASGETTHVQASVAKAFIQSGLAEEIIIPTFAERIAHDRAQRRKEIEAKNPSINFYPNTAWTVHTPVVGNVLFSPEIHYKCRSCGQKGSASGPTVHKTLVFNHCNLFEKPPADVTSEFVRLRKEYERKAKQ